MSTKPDEARHTRRLAALKQGQKPDGLDCYFAETVQQLRPYMYTIAFSILGNRDNADDTVSEALLKAYTNLHGFTLEERENLKVKAWLAQIIRNLCFDFQNKEKGKESLELLTERGLQIIAHSYTNPENGAIYSEGIAILSKCLTALPLLDREIVRRYVMLGEPATSIAENLGISRSTLYVRVWRTIRKLRHPSFSRQLLNRYDEGTYEFIIGGSRV